MGETQIAGQAQCHRCGTIENVPEDLADKYQQVIDRDPDRPSEGDFTQFMALHLVDCPTPEAWHPHKMWMTLHLCKPCRPKATIVCTKCGDNYQVPRPLTVREFNETAELATTASKLHQTQCKGQTK